MMNKCVLLYSGGIDSTNTILILKDRDFTIYPLFIDYDHKAKGDEIKAARYFSSYFNIEKLKVMKFKHWNTYSHPLITKSGIDSFKNDERPDGASINYLPYRNLVFAILGVIYGKSVGAQYLSFGFVKDTIAKHFPDASKDFVIKLNELLKLIDDSYSGIQIISESHKYSKSQLIENGIANGIPLKKTYSCYSAFPRCGHCESCLQVISSFEKIKNKYDINILKKYNPYYGKSIK